MRSSKGRGSGRNMEESPVQNGANASASLTNMAGRGKEALARRMARLALGGSRRYYSIILILIAWEIISRSGFVRTVLFPPVSLISQQFALMLADGSLLKEALTSMRRAFLGLSLATALGIPLGIAMARLRLFKLFFDLPIAIGFPTPKVTFIPVFILWFGIGDQAKVFLVAFACIFPIVVSTYNGARGTPQTFIWSARSLGTSERKLLAKIVLPSTLPFIFNGLRVSLPLSLIIVFVSEMVSGGGGLGYVLIFSIRFLETPTEFATLFAIIIIGYAMDKLLLRLRRRMLRWHAETALH